MGIANGSMSNSVLLIRQWQADGESTEDTPYNYRPILRKMGLFPPEYKTAPPWAPA